MHKKMRIKQIFLATLVAFLPIFCSAQEVYPSDDSTDTEQHDSTVITESKLVFPNAFSPNGDGINDVFKAKEYQSLAEFHAYIFNRWGQKLYDWTDPDEGWDGTSGGKDVKDGVYFVLVKAKGTDGVVYEFRKDVNLLRGYSQNTTTR